MPFFSFFRRGGHHGQNRRARASSYRNPLDRAGDGPGGAAFLAAFATVADRPGGSSEPSIPTGIRTGEIIGHRLWWVVLEDGKLWLGSIAHRQLWRPGGVVTGNLRANVAPNIRGGVYSYMTSAGLGREIEFWTAGNGRIIRYYDETPALVCGTVKLWGEVIEHNNEGYRAEFAKLHSLRAVVWGSANLDAMRRRYFG